MGTTKVVITLDRKVLDRVDSLVKKRVFPNRSKVIQRAVEEKLERLERSRLARECARLDPAFERTMAEVGMSAEQSQWEA